MSNNQMSHIARQIPLNGRYLDLPQLAMISGVGKPFLDLSVFCKLIVIPNQVEPD